jgi:hypothetical protein
VEHYLLVRQPRHIFDEIQQELLKIFIVRQEQSEKFIRFFEGNNCKNLEIFNVKVQLFEDKPFIGGQDIISFFASDDLTDGVSPNQEFDQFRCCLGLKFHKILAKLDDVLFLLLQRNFHANILQGMFVIFFILDQNLEIQLVFVLLFC